MKELDIRTKNILNALESTLTHSKAFLDSATHEAMVESILKATIAVKEAHDKFKHGEMSNQQYGKVLLRLAELGIMAIRRLPG